MSTSVNDDAVAQGDGPHKLRTDPDLPPVGVIEAKGSSPINKVTFVIIGVLCAIGWTMIAIVRGERVNALWFVLAAVGSYLLALRFYARLIENKIIKPDDRRATPAEEFSNGKDFMPTDRRVLFGHHFAAISGAGPLVGPVLAAQMGYLPGTIWIIVGVVLAGGVQDYMVLALSTRRKGRSLGQMARDELGPVGGWAAIIGVLTIMIILIAVLGVVMIGAMAESPWAVFSISLTIPIALFMGVYLRYLRPGKVSEVSLIGVVLLVAAIAAGSFVNDSATWAPIFTLSGTSLAIWLAVYGFAAAVLPVWLLLAPRDYLSTFMKVGTIILLAVAILIVAPVIQQPAVSQFAFNSNGPSFAGSLFPFLFITIACGALSGFHALISSGTTPKLLEKESQARLIGYGGMLTESFVAVMAIVAASVIDQHVYFAMNASAGLTGGTPESAAAYTNGLGLLAPGGQPLPPIDPAYFTQAAQDVGEKTIISRTGGAPTLAFGMAEVLNQIPVIGHIKAFWYHFAVMFEALFILTTIDAGTRVARFMLSDTLGNIPGMRKFKDTSWRPGAWLCTAIVVLAWGSLLYMGVTDPLGGIRMLFPLFGIANQLLAAIALAVVFAIVMKKGLFKWAWIPGIPLFWDTLVTMVASWQKIFSSNPQIGYWTQHTQARAALERCVAGQPCRYQTATSQEQLEAVIRNTFVQGTLSIIYALLVAIVVIVALMVSVKALRNGGLPTDESEAVPSKIFAPKSFVPTKLEKEVYAEWKEAGLEPAPDGRGHG
ncbi:carbon starvation CstA family protein [Enemella evansiae]|uniref:Carbon starvation protein A n=1 Tax=Enemella evansiae TaxID=2016499 RepID=A0A255G3R3_9ACTN|nr:carbon starvation CstA family protein [Enemella evansiae]PFG67120.1 carbon starvation protein [Propionibacteriaceae bacterium ES.041]OYN98222.1 carbon starvation protein A [Enemella evansiae]OYN99310.1 carbon starvation protein A [Enemella evansiae]OYO05392.1 carbon starvation protein A [Enemella evansiae]OYO10558.1 carbon starvation protein A [Enemella evansiae]